MRRRFAKWPTAGRSPAASSTDRSPSITPSRRRLQRPRESFRPSQDGLTFSSCRISKRGTCWRSSSNIWPRQRSQALCSARAFRSFLQAAPIRCFRGLVPVRSRFCSRATKPEANRERRDPRSERRLVEHQVSLFPGHIQPTRQDLICDGECEGIGQQVHFIAKDGDGAVLIDERLPESATHEFARLFS